MRSVLATMLATACLSLPTLLPNTARAESGTQAGFFAGLNIADLHTAPTGGTSSDGNFLFGGFAEFPVSEAFYVEPQLRYIEKGADITNFASSTAGGLDLSLTIKYLEIPVYAKWKFREGQAFRPYLFAGPNLGFRIGSSVTAKTRNAGLAVTTTGVLGSELKSLDLAADAGAGAEFAFGEAFLFRVAASYSMGLMNIDESSGTIKTRGLQAYAGLGFPL